MENVNADTLKLLKQQEPVISTVVFKFLNNATPLKILLLVNECKAADVRTLVRKMSSIAHFCQFMADYFAHDDALEPALADVCKILRDNDDAGAMMQKRATMFLGMAQSFQKLRSPKTTMIYKCTFQNKKIVKAPDFQTTFTPSFPRRFSFKFQKTSSS